MKFVATIVVALVGFCSLGAQTAQRWKEVILPAPYDGGYYLDIFFLPSNPNLGWACDQFRGYVVRTTDGGNTWQGSSVSGGTSCHLEYIQFLDANVGYASGPCGMYKSIDGGRTWTSIKPAGSPTIWGGWFKNANEGWFVGGGCGSCTFLRTVDGGTTFTSVTETSVGRSVMSDPYWAPDMAPGEVFAVGSGTLWRSGDDGVTWQFFANTGTNAPWHEELAMVGQSVLIPNDRERCGSAAPTTLGMRFSTNRGTTWRDFVTGESMYGTFLHDAQRGWAAGTNEAVYYTSNSGQAWTKRSCGLNGADLDDVFFIDDNNGWVVGDGIFRTAPALRTQSDSALQFRLVCSDSAGIDTVRVQNVNWFASPWSASIIGTDAAMFSIANAPLSATIGTCEFRNIVVRYKPTTRTTHTAVLAITFQQPDTTLYVTLEGQPFTPTAAPFDTLVTYTAPVGQPLAKTLLWRSTSATMLESIVSITYAWGDSTVTMTAARYPEIVRTDVTLTYINAIPRDTGWTQTRFRVKLAPCMRDTFITVRIYGVSPIITCPAGVLANASCKQRDTLRIPISNTGNETLEISTLRISTVQTNAFTLIGFVSGRAGAPWKMTVGQKDTLLIAYVPDRGRDAATLEIVNNDLTRKRGVKTPWIVNLQGNSDRPRLTVDKRTIDLGSICGGAIISRTINVTNIGLVAGSVSATKGSSLVELEPSGTVAVSPGQVRQLTVTVNATREGRFTDTVMVRIAPCDTLIPVVITGMVEAPEIRITPSIIADTGAPNEILRGRAVITLVQGQGVSVRDIRITPLPAQLKFILPQLPITLAGSDSIVVDFTYSSATPSEYRGVIEVVAATSCSTTASSEIRFSVVSNDVRFTPNPVEWEYLCTNARQEQKITIEARGSLPVTVLSARRRGATSPFFVTGPSFPLTVNPGTPRAITVLFDPPTTGVYSDTIDIDTDVEGADPAIALKGAYQTADIQADPSVVSTVQPCDPDQVFWVRVSNIGGAPTRISATASATLAKATITPMMLNVPPLGTDSVQVRIRPSDYAPGTALLGHVIFKEDVCGDADSTSVSVFIADLKSLRLQPDPLDVGVIIVGSRAVGSVTIENPGADTVTITRAVLEPATSVWTLRSGLVGQRIAPSASIFADVEFIPTAAGRVTTRLVVESQGACADTAASSLVGEGREPRVPITYRVPLRVDEYVVGPSTRLDIPVHLDANVSDALIDTLQWTVRYHAVNLVVDSIISGTAPDVDLTASIETGAIRFLAVRRGPLFGSMGSLGIIRATSRSAIPDSTPLSITDMRAVSKELTELVNNDGYVIVDACGPRNLITFAEKTKFRLAPPLPITGAVLTINAEAEQNDVAYVDVTDALGQVVASHSGIPVVRGPSTLQLDISSLSSGTYFVVVRSNSRGSITAFVPVVR
ncbi:MAG: choice-of-anchor D domain-containing protein [Candidatus Kapabacteria bacterium]|nr:choice-of-anchor D domain-containing protein [Candidatus Kapabacteria bacterium]